jgi:hypothetical protein
VRAAVAVAREHGIDVTEPQVLADGANAMVHLRPAPVVARVATTTGVVRVEPQRWLARDLAVAAFLARHGAPVVPPSDDVPPGPHRHDDLWLTFWRFMPHDTAEEPSPVSLGRALASLHEVLRGFDGELPWLGPPREDARGVLDRLEALELVVGDEIARLRGALDDCDDAMRAVSLPAQALHGDANHRNVLMTEQGLCWTDFEDACSGPVAWDIATVLRRSGDEARRAYGDGPADAELAPFMAAREVQAEIWMLVYDTVGPPPRNRA